jgi:hypothetical protein
MARARGINDVEAVAFFPADHATVAQGKVYINGAFWTVVTHASYPVVEPQLTIVAVLRVPWPAYERDHAFVVTMQDADGRPVPLRIEGAFRVDANPVAKEGEPTIVPVTANVQNLSIPAPGDYTFILWVDGEEVARYSVKALARTPG